MECVYVYVYVCLLCVICIVFVHTVGLIYVSDSCWELDIAQSSPALLSPQERKVSQSVPEHVVYRVTYIRNKLHKKHLTSPCIPSYVAIFPPSAPRAS